MKLLGAHMSVEGGAYRALDRGAQAGCQAVQLFTRSSRQWASRPMENEQAGIFKKLKKSHEIVSTLSHASYLINMASPDSELQRKSAAALADELDNCDQLGIPYLIIHPGAHMGSGVEEAFKRIATLINKIFRKRPADGAKILLETTAGMGTSIGHRFEHLREILAQLEAPERVAVCVDTCHLFAAGYDISTRKGYMQVMENLDDVVGLDKVRAFHLNDSKKGLGCRLDRHEHIGLGALGVTAFWSLLNDPRFDDVPMVLETPKGKDLVEDVTNLALLRAQIGSRRPVTGPTVSVPASKAAIRSGKTKKGSGSGKSRSSAPANRKGAAS
jgi:deoxyribonuclease-4